jgi:hypothetical protein
VGAGSWVVYCTYLGLHDATWSAIFIYLGAQYHIFAGAPRLGLYLVKFASETCFGSPAHGPPGLDVAQSEFVLVFVVGASICNLP